MDNRKVLKIGMCVGYVKLLINHTPPRTTGRRSRSQGRIKLCIKLQTSSDGGNIPVL